MSEEPPPTQETKRGRKSFLTPEIKREKKKAWEAANPDRVAAYRRKGVLQTCLKRASLPSKATVERYEFTKEELDPIYEALHANRREIACCA
tara:strand:+ start:227 stop:502 length:276 start_codon:yes stop_codon:yes gene_type:complete